MDISVVIPAHNAGPYIEECLTSIIRADQQGLSVEVIVIDDASSDDTALRTETFAQRCPIPLRVVRNTHNQGAGHSRAAGLQHASGRFIAFIDADDLIFPTRFVDQVRLLDDNPKILLCGGDLIELDQATQRSPRALMFPTNSTDICADMLFYCPMWAGTTMFRRELIDRLPYPTRRVGEDWLFAFEASRLGQIANTGKPAIYYRLHSQQVTASPGSGLDAVLWMWEHMLTRIGVKPTERELRLHALCSPYVRSDPCAIPELKRDSIAAEWESWSVKLKAAAVEYAPALSERCRKILQMIHACRYVDNEVIRVF